MCPTLVIQDELTVTFMTGHKIQGQQETNVTVGNWVNFQS